MTAEACSSVLTFTGTLTVWEERARIVLNMAGNGEYVILEKDIDKQQK